ncbi:MAG: NADH-quinone oxidoreductase subunit C [Chloroflexota bacterium]
MAGSEAVVQAVRAAIGEGLLGVDEDRAGTPVLIVDRGSIRDACHLLRDGEGKYAHLSGVWGVDYLGMELEPRFAVVYYLYSPTLRQRVALKVPLEENDAVVPSVVEIFPGANWHERETFDMYGIRFVGHPNLTRILMPEDATFYPLRKDVPIGGEEVEFTHNTARLRQQRAGESSEVSRN